MAAEHRQDIGRGPERSPGRGRSTHRTATATRVRADASSFIHVEYTAASTRRDSEALDSAEVEDIATHFDLLERPHRRRMVVLGDPGSGKTVAATYLVLGLLGMHRELPDARRTEEPVPVRVDAAGWDCTRSLTHWLVTRLRYDYRLHLRVGREMIDRRLILPVIDGLDEMDPPNGDRSRARALPDRLNRAPGVTGRSWSCAAPVNSST